MQIQHTWITPEQASEWLQKNATNNRNRSQKTIKQYAKDMLQGEWRLTGEAIKFDTTGRLIDGQHRLHAVVMAGVSVEMLIITGLEPDAIQVLDTGKTRTAGDALVISGNMGSANAIAALCRKIIAYEGGWTDAFNTKSIKLKGESITNREVIEYTRLYDLSPHVLFAAKRCYDQVTKIFNSGEWAFIHWLLCTRDQEAAETFLCRLATLDNVPATSTIRTLFDKLTKSTVALSPKQRLQATIIAWNANREGRTITKIQVSNIEGAVKPL